MSTHMTIAVIAVPADNSALPDLEKGRQLLEQVTDPSLFDFDDPQDDIEALVPDLDPGTEVVDNDGQPILTYAKRAGLAIIQNLADALASRETTYITVAGYRIYMSGGLSSSDTTDAAEAIYDVYTLPVEVIQEMGVIIDYEKPLSRTNGNRGHVTDTDVVDAIALGLGTKRKHDSTEAIMWISDSIDAVRPNPGRLHGCEYLGEFIAQHSFDPADDNFLIGYVSAESDDDNGEDGDDDEE